ncbi:MAG: lipopolysaccharide kinase InaA family protein [Planctomycetota bacterium]
MAGPPDPSALRRAYGVPDAVRLRDDGAEVLAWVDGAEEPVRAVASRPDRLPPARVTGRAPLSRIESAVGPLFVREYRKGGLLRAVRGRRFRGRFRPLEELSLSRRLLAVRVPVLECVGAVVLRSLTGWRGFLLSKEVRGAVDLQTFLYAPAAHAEWPVTDALAAAGAAVRALHDAGVSHADLHPKNLLLDAETAGVRVLDLDRARAFDAPLTEAQRLDNLARLARSVEKHRLKGMAVGRRAALRFLRAYGGSPEAGDRWLERVRARLRPGLPWHVLWWRLSGQVRPRRPRAAVPVLDDGGGAP